MTMRITRKIVGKAKVPTYYVNDTPVAVVVGQSLVFLTSMVTFTESKREQARGKVTTKAKRKHGVSIIVHEPIGKELVLEDIIGNSGGGDD